MDTLTPAHVWQHTSIRLRTSHGSAFTDITARLDRCVAAAKVRLGTIAIQTRHTTTGLLVNEDEPLLLADFLALFERLVPRTTVFGHDDMARRSGVGPDEPLNGHAHCRALLLPTSVTLTIDGGGLALGRWQRVFLVEFDGPRDRELSLVISGEAAS
jgi:secondary thiamine-phosphate synthase enzyme